MNSFLYKHNNFCGLHERHCCRYVSLESLDGKPVSKSSVFLNDMIFDKSGSIGIVVERLAVGCIVLVVSKQATINSSNINAQINRI